MDIVQISAFPTVFQGRTVYILPLNWSILASGAHVSGSAACVVDSFPVIPERTAPDD